ncbi:hypothetical protein JD844_009710 [Phrynosoma platyrhinos]|uniref:Uncharacterized protein n=1 Tax=Phrynosoma platyrhinos TaxID=52577 RepID=A0ABQ7TGF0_PHRPL|nr:hypothetical protein JD844_009710 [Phrynosoma platyrhinos]
MGSRFVVMFMHITMCPHGQEETSFLDAHQTQYVQQLMRKSPLQSNIRDEKDVFHKTFPNHKSPSFLISIETPFLCVVHVFFLINRQPEKPWFQRKVYEWDPYFQFPSRMICMAVLAIICLYMFVVMEHYIYMQVSRALETLELDLETLISSTNTSSNASEVIASVQHLKEFIATTEGVWIFTTFTASLTCVSYVFHILACYRKHMKRLWAGQKEFLPLVFSKLSSSQSVASIARYSGWQIAYILWGYLIIHMVQCLLGVMIMYSFVLPIMNGQGIKMTKSWGMVIFTLSIVMGLMLLQIRTASIFFLQPKILLNDKEKPLALDNRKVFHNFNYFLFFYNVMLGLSACLFRLLCNFRVSNKARTRWLLLYTLLNNPSLSALRKPK